MLGVPDFAIFLTSFIDPQTPVLFNFHEPPAAELDGEVRAEDEQADKGGHAAVLEGQKELYCGPDSCQSGPEVLREREKVLVYNLVCCSQID